MADINLLPLMKEIGRRIQMGEAHSDGLDIEGDGSRGTLVITQKYKFETPEAIAAIERIMEQIGVLDRNEVAPASDDDRARRIRSQFKVFGPDIRKLTPSQAGTFKGRRRPNTIRPAAD